MLHLKIPAEKQRLLQLMDGTSLQDVIFFTVREDKLS